MATTAQTDEAAAPGLRRGLKLSDAAAFSIRTPRWQAVIPLGVWLLIGLALVLAVPGLAARVRGELKRSEQESAAEQGLEPARVA